MLEKVRWFSEGRETKVVDFSTPYRVSVVVIRCEVLIEGEKIEEVK